MTLGDPTHRIHPTNAALQAVPIPFFIVRPPEDDEICVSAGNDAAERLLVAARLRDDAHTVLPMLADLLGHAGPSSRIIWLGRTFRVEIWRLDEANRGALLTDITDDVSPRADDLLWAQCGRRSPVPIVWVRVAPRGALRGSPIVAANEAADAFAGRGMLGRTLAEFLGGLMDDAAWDRLRETVASPRDVREFRCGREGVPVRLRVCFDGQSLGIAVEDVSYEVHIERSLTRQAERLAQCERDLDQLSATVGVGLEAPLRALARCAELFLADRRQDDGALTEVQELAAACHAARRTLSTVLDYVRMGEQETTARRIPLQSLVDSLLARLGDAIDAAGARISVGRLPVVWGVESELELVLRSLLVHALELDDGQRERLEGVSGGGGRRLRISASATRDGWRIAIHDGMQGAVPDDAEMLDEYARRARRALANGGVPLVMCRRIVERHGGRIDVFVDGREGKTIWFEWPGHAHRDQWRDDQWA